MSALEKTRRPATAAQIAELRELLSGYKFTGLQGGILVDDIGDACRDMMEYGSVDLADVGAIMRAEFKMHEQSVQDGEDDLELALCPNVGRKLSEGFV